MHAHWQNMNEDARGRVKGRPWKGRAWLNRDSRGQLQIEWVLGRAAWPQLVALVLAILGARMLGGGWANLLLVVPAITATHVWVDAGDQGVALRLSLPLLTLYLVLEDVVPNRVIQWLAAGAARRDISLTFHDGSVWWNLGMDPDEWRHNDPRWRRGSWNPLDTLLGASVYTSQVVSERDVLVPLPERAYPARCKVSLAEWKRPRWFKHARYQTELDMGDNPIPVHGKGENAWDCGDDAIYRQSTGASTPEQAIADLVGSVLRTRHRRGGTHQPPAKPAHQPTKLLALLDTAATLMTGPGDTWAIPPDKQTAADRWFWEVRDERARCSNPVAYADAILSGLQDGQAMALAGTYGQLLRVLSNHCGEQTLLARGTSEGAVDTLQRIVGERDRVAAQVVAGALFDFLGYLTSRDKSLTVGAAHDSPAVLDVLTAWATLRGLRIDEAMVERWQAMVGAAAVRA